MTREEAIKLHTDIGISEDKLTFMALPGGIEIVLIANPPDDEPHHMRYLAEMIDEEWPW